MTSRSRPWPAWNGERTFSLLLIRQRERRWWQSTRSVRPTLPPSLPPFLPPSLLRCHFPHYHPISLCTTCPVFTTLHVEFNRSSGPSYFLLPPFPPSCVLSGLTRHPILGNPLLPPSLPPFLPPRLQLSVPRT